MESPATVIFLAGAPAAATGWPLASVIGGWSDSAETVFWSEQLAARTAQASTAQAKTARFPSQAAVHLLFTSLFVGDITLEQLALLSVMSEGSVDPEVVGKRKHGSVGAGE